MKSQISKETDRRKWAKKAVIKAYPDRCEVYFRKGAEIFWDATVIQLPDGKLTCNCEGKSIPDRCRHIVAVEILMGIYKNPYQIEADLILKIEHDNRIRKEKRRVQQLTKKNARKQRQAVR